MLREMIQEVRLTPDRLIWPLFVQSDQDPEPIVSLPGQKRHSITSLLEAAGLAMELRIGGVMLFGVLPDSAKDPWGRGAYAPEGIVQEAIRQLKRVYPQLLVLADTCLCEYTSHGHCGVLSEGNVDNDATLELLAQTAVSQARAGADIVAPSAMMDGQVSAIRTALDKAEFTNVPILAYAVKYASAFYGPFREAAGSAPAFGDRSGYQMDPAAGYWDALREANLDDQEGADLLMVKPALPYLDVLVQLKHRFNKPLAAYQVSGEYAMLKAAAGHGWLDERRAVLESLTAIRRAGAQMILTYYAPEAAIWLREG
jgi:porphobilinogen synthase